jgi:hypothetical protein
VRERLPPISSAPSRISTLFASTQETSETSYPALATTEAFEEEQGTQTLVTVGGLHAEHAEAVGLDFLKLQPEGHLQKSEDALAAAGCMKDLVHIWQREGKPYFTPIGTDE